ncbi:MAG: trigger factor [Deltaproteobacteria bacterium]|nr:trigger factor [Deltaproteobacteria bacterium]
MKTTLEEISSVKKKLKVEVPAAEVLHAQSHALEKLKKEIKLPGFRQGKIPDAMIHKQFSHELNRETIEEVINHSLPHAFAEAKVNPISRPEVDGGLLGADGGYTYTATFEVVPEISLTEKDLEGLKLEQEEIEIEKEEIDQEIKRLQDAMTYLEPLPDDTKAENGHVLTIDFSGLADGKSFKGGDGKDFVCELGAKQLLSEFETNLTGLKAGDEKEFPINYPKDYFNEELAGKKGSFKIKLKSVRKKNVPTLDDSFAKDLGKFQNMGEVKEDVKKRITAHKEQHAKNGLYNQIVERLIEKKKFEIPEALIHNELDYLLKEVAHEGSKQGKELQKEEIPKLVEQLRPTAETRVRGFLVLNKASHLAKIEVAEKEIDDHLDSIAKSAKRPLPEIKAYYEKKNLLPSIEIKLIHEKTLEFILKEAKIKTVKAKKEKK